MGLLDLKIVLLVVLAAAMALLLQSSDNLVAPSAFTTDAGHATGWSPAALTAAAKTAVASFLNTTNTSSSSSSSSSSSMLTTAAASTLRSFLRTEEARASSNSSTAAASAAAPAAPAVASNKTVHKLCVLSRIHNQPRSLAEWLEYHAALGVTRFYLVDDCSSDGGLTRTVLDVYKQEGLVKYFTPYDVSTRMTCASVIAAAGEAVAEQGLTRRRQRLCRAADAGEAAAPLDDEAAKQFDQSMKGCAYSCGDGDGGEHRPNEHLLFQFLFEQATSAPDETCEWLMVFDTDEYMTFQTDLFPTPDVPAYFADYEARTNGFPILRFPWVLMGSDGHEERPPGLVIDNSQHGFFGRWMLKTAGKSDFLRTWDFSHWPAVKDVSNETSVAAHGFEIPPPFATLKEFTERNWQTEERDVKGTEMLYRNVTDPATNQMVECLYPNYGVFLKHYSWRSFAEFEAHRGKSRVKSDGQGNHAAVDDPHGTWMAGDDARSFHGPCSEHYFNDFTARMADTTRANLAARRRAWDERHQVTKAAAAADGDFSTWIREAECGAGSGEYSGAFPPVEEWVIRR